MIPTILLTITVQTVSHLLNSRAWVDNQKQRPPVVVSEQPLLRTLLWATSAERRPALGWSWELCEGGGEHCCVGFARAENEFWCVCVPGDELL